DLTDGDNLSRGPANEYFIGDIDLVAGDRLLNYRVAEIAGQSNQTVSGDTFEDRTSRDGVDLAVSHDKQILSSTFGDVTGRVEHDGFIKAEADGFGFCQHGADVIAGDLGLGHHDVGMKTSEGCDISANTELLGILTEKRSPLPNRYRQTG